ncbi:hypothetical protein PAECIP112173_00922 [Paenibacillus sp. JJ-100]|nr:hypothetical protein PAECIP112173_00922 [Paenibacillus sp. JJ-100]
MKGHCLSCYVDANAKGTKSILKKRSVRLCLSISTLQKVNLEMEETTAIERMIRNRNGHIAGWPE